jgi:hypothetical protein
MKELNLIKISIPAEHYLEAFEWCVKNIGTVGIPPNQKDIYGLRPIEEAGWSVISHYDPQWPTKEPADFYFIEKPIAAVFKLRWL